MTIFWGEIGKKVKKSGIFTLKLKVIIAKGRRHSMPKAFNVPVFNAPAQLPEAPAQWREAPEFNAPAQLPEAPASKPAQQPEAPAQ